MKTSFFILSESKAGFFFSFLFSLSVESAGYFLLITMLNLLWQIKTIPQVEAALGFLGLVGPESYDVAEFEKKCGVGMCLSSPFSIWKTFSKRSTWVFMHRLSWMQFKSGLVIILFLYPLCVSQQINHMWLQGWRCLQQK